MTTIKLNNKEVSLEAIKAILTEEQIKELTREGESGVFVPKWFECYFYVTDRGTTFSYVSDDNETDTSIIENNLVYRTEEEALEAQKRNQARIRVIRKIAELNASVGWKVDWEDFDQTKCFMGHNHKEPFINIAFLDNKLFEDFFYFSEEIADQVLEACAEDYKIMLWIK